MSLIPYKYGTFRTHNGANAGLDWATIQAAKGTYVGNGVDQANMVLTWTAFDTMLAEAIAVNVEICYMMWRAPTWAVSAGDQAFTDGFGGAGASGVPLNNQYITDFVTAVLQRAISLGKRIKYLELWNEPLFGGGGNGVAFTGTAAQMVAMCRAAYNAAKAVDSSIVVLCPSQYLETAMTAFLSATDGTKFGYQVCDWLNIHPYRQGPNKATQSGADAIYWAAGGGLGLKRAQQLLVNLGQPTKPVAITEWGLSTQSTDPEVVAFNALSSAAKKQYIKRFIYSCAALGCPLVIPFSNGNLAGDYTNDTAGVIAAITECQNELAGATITDGGWLNDGSYILYKSNGSKLIA